MEAVESSLVLDRQVYSTEVYKKFDNLSKVLGDSIMENSVAIRILWTNHFNEGTPGAVRNITLEMVVKSQMVMHVHVAVQALSLTSLQACHWNKGNKSFK